MKNKITLLVLITVGLFALQSCEDIEEKAEKASAEACECIKKKSRSKCEEELNDQYKQYVNNDEFIKTFNSTNTCNLYIYKKATKALDVSFGDVE
jgi:hypothetical protein